MDDRTHAARKIIAECFWGDYNLTPEELLSRLDSGEPGFDGFLFSKIMENSGYPSGYIGALFPPEQARELLDRYLKRSKKSRRIRLAAANITGNDDLVPEYRWNR